MPEKYIAIAFLSLISALHLPVGAIASSLEYGLRTGGLFASTESAGRTGFHLRALARRPLASKWKAELVLGYGRARGQDYTTDMALIDLKTLFEPVAYEDWRPYLSAGLGLLRYDIADIPPTRTPDAKALGLSFAVPLGFGADIPLNQRLSLNFAADFTYTFRDDIDGVILEKGNDLFWSTAVGLMWHGSTEPRARSAETSTTPSLRAEPATQDRDGDGLTDREETRQYFTNPLMADSDGDGLTDFDEIEVHHTDPNRPDTDGGEVRDGDEIERGTDPLDPDDDNGDDE